MIYDSLTDLIGNTPLLEVKDYEGQKARIVLKIESFNPGGSAKDRIALRMILDAEAKGILKKGATIIEPTSGNTGVGLSWVGKSRGYEVILTMPESMSQERRSLLKAYGARLELTPASQGMKGAIARAQQLKEEIPGAVILGQFDNPSNPLAHEKTTGEEIWRDTEGKVDIFVAGVGTGGTLTGSSRTLKRHNPSIKAIGAEPDSSPVLSGGESGKHGIQGIGAGFVPEVYDPSVVDGIIRVKDDEAMEGARLLAAKEGLLVGISSGAAFHAALSLARKEENCGKMIVALLPDTGERYLSTPLFSK
ncbi:MAG: cysteine synthase A [Bacteroidales bacterium]|nr:cysteine synthase A [Bacteroidales bacterium]MBQ9173715.1 cysteine synthase A [Bacteroidales bacterium]MBQ9713527.1 cysteine synthase A [Bacteroidales bacterium]MBR1436686.1 cysteine synthase A [Bacteroidales bacterium]